jgi:hypothetical protein
MHKSLLLTPRQIVATLGVQIIFDFVPQGRGAQRLLDVPVQVPPKAVDAQPERHVLVDGFGEGVGLLKDHPDSAAHLDGVHVGIVDVLAVIEHLSAEAHPRDEIVHAIEAADERALAAP